MEGIPFQKRIPGLIAALMVLALLGVSCNGVSEPLPSMEEIERIATQTIQAILAAGEPGSTATATPIPTATLFIPTATLSPTDTPLPTPAPNLPGAIRINFAPGATYGSAKGTIGTGQSQYFVLGALIGQPMQASVSSINNDVTMRIFTQGGIELLPAGQNRSNWQGSLPATQDYYFEIIGGQSVENYTFWVSISSRIKFEPGATSATVRGKTVEGYNTSYVVGAQGGQTMDILLTPDYGNVALTVWGFSDGQPYMRSVTGSTTFHMQLPSTQDYIINVVPQGGQIVTYSLRVEIK